jgi:RHS repeat-associated protein
MLSHCRSRHGSVGGRTAARDRISIVIEVNDQNDSPIASYGYDYLGRRVKKEITSPESRVTRYVYDGGQVISEYEDGTLVRKLIYGPGIDEPIMMLVVNGSETKYYYHFDGLGSVVALSNVNSEIVERYSYDVFGEPNTTSTVGNPYFFTGRAYDSEIGLYYYRARYYKPEIGRFLQTDLIGYYDSMNLYTYVENNPINWADPYGLCKDSINWDELGWWDYTLLFSRAFVEGAATPFIDVATMPGDYYDIFRSAGMGSVEAGLQSANMTAGKIFGYGTLSEGILGVDVRTISLTSGWQRAGQVGFGAAQTAVSTVAFAEGLYAVTTKTIVRTRYTLGADGATSQIIKTKSRVTGKTLKVVQKVTLDGKVIHMDQKFP